MEPGLVVCKAGSLPAVLSPGFAVSCQKVLRACHSNVGCRAGSLVPTCMLAEQGLEDCEQEYGSNSGSRTRINLEVGYVSFTGAVISWSPSKLPGRFLPRGLQSLEEHLLGLPALQLPGQEGALSAAAASGTSHTLPAVSQLPVGTCPLRPPQHYVPYPVQDTTGTQEHPGGVRALALGAHGHPTGLLHRRLGLHLPAVLVHPLPRATLVLPGWPQGGSQRAGAVA